MKDTLEPVEALAHELGRVYWAAHHDHLDSRVADAMAEAALSFRVAGSPSSPVQVKALDDLASMFWRVDAEDVGAPPSVAAGRTRQAFDEQADETKETWRKFARAARSSLSPSGEAEPKAWTPEFDEMVAVDPILSRAASIICDAACGSYSHCLSREAAVALRDAGLLVLSAKTDT